jgi:serine/threonine-protein kinase
VAYQHVREQPQPPSTYDEGLPPEVDAIVMKALTKDVGQRYQSAAAMRADIDRFLAGKPVVAPPVPAAAAAEPTGFFSGTAEEPVAEDEEERSRRWPVVLLILALLVLLGLAVVFGPVLLGSSSKAVPQLTNLTRTQAEQRIRAADLTVGDISEAASDDVARGRVVRSDPAARTKVSAGDPVDLVVSTGKPDVVVPYVVGKDKDAARQDLVSAGLKVKLTKKQSDEAKDTVVATNPDPATSVSKGSTVTVFYSAGPKKVPSVVGLTEDEARSKLEGAGFKVDTVHDSSTKATKGTVLEQSPSAFTTQPQGTTVVITVSTYVKPSPTPTPTPPTPTETPTESPSETPTTSSSASPTP